MDVSVVVLAAGEGTRMRSGLPKVLHPLAGRPMVCHVVEAVRGMEPACLVAVVGSGAEQVRAALGDGVACAEQAERLGTAHALRQAEPLAGGRAQTVLVVYGDTPLIRPGTLQRLVGEHEVSGAAVTLLTFRPGDPTGYGRIVRDGPDGRVVGIVEEKEATEPERAIAEANSGILCLRDEWAWEALGQVPRRVNGEYYLTDLAALAAQEGLPVAALACNDELEVMGVDDRVKLARAEAEARRRINEGWMLAGVTLVDPTATYIDAGVEIGPDCVVWPGTYLQGRTRIGRGCRLGPGAVVRDSTLGDRCRVELSVLEGAVMEEGSDVGPFSHLRKGARLGRGAHVGNFGEIKNSTLGEGVKMGHFSYLGDATVGAEANIGAGTITCNFDGQEKHPTSVGANAFIGSDTLLVAPVTVGEGAKTGAGSVVTRDVPPGRVAYGVPARVRSAAGDGAPGAQGTEEGT